MDDTKQTQIDISENAQHIFDSIQKLESLVDQLEEVANSKATAIMEYEKEIAVTIIKLRNGVIQKFEGQEIKSIPANLIHIVAKGICYRQGFDNELAECFYNKLNKQIDAARAILNGYQSIFKVMN
jgi:hypothetical protein